MSLRANPANGRDERGNLNILRMSNIMFFQRFTLFGRLLRHSVPRNDKLVFQKSGEESGAKLVIWLGFGSGNFAENLMF